jgi:hypothetical protein
VEYSSIKFISVLLTLQQKDKFDTCFTNLHSLWSNQMIITSENIVDHKNEHYESIASEFCENSDENVHQIENTILMASRHSM